MLAWYHVSAIVLVVPAVLAGVWFRKWSMRVGRTRGEVGRGVS